MSFRNRLAALFALLVLLPIVSVGALLIRSADQIDNGANQARTNQATYVTGSLYTKSKEQLFSAAQELSQDISKRGAWRFSTPELYRWIQDKMRSIPQIRSVTLLDSKGSIIREIGEPGGLNSAQINLVKAKPGSVQTLLVSGIDYSEFTTQVADLNGAEAILLKGEVPVASTLEVPEPIDGDDYRSATGEDYSVGEIKLGSKPEPVVMQVLLKKERLTTLESSPFLLGAFFLLLVLAVAFGVMINKSIHNQTKAMLEAARRIGEGDFSTQVPVEGGDELAGLADEFNKMSGLIQDQVGNLIGASEKMRDAIHLFSESVTTTDAGALQLTLKVITETLEADLGQFWVRDQMISHSGGSASESAKLTSLSEKPEIDEGDYEIHRVERDGWFVLQVRVPREGAGVMSISRRALEFTADEEEILRAFLNQLAVISDNLRLNEQLIEQATIDELTGLPNRRSFTERFKEEIERSVRIGHPLSLIILDVDDFKKINDTRGHQAGDEVLRGIGELFERATRSEIDFSARWGGEEFAVLLPETELKDAIEVAERICELAPKVTASTISCSVSVGVASMYDHAENGDELLRAADDAMYRAKRNGKNRVEIAKMGMRR